MATLAAAAGSATCAAQPLEIAANAGAITPPFYLVDGTLTQTNDTTIDEGGKAVYTFSVTNGGNYVVFASVAGRPGKPCSMRICFDEETRGTNNIWHFDAGENVTRKIAGSSKNAVSNRNYTVYRLEPGEHRLLVRAATGGLKVQKFDVRPLLTPARPGAPHVANASN